MIVHLFVLHKREENKSALHKKGCPRFAEWLQLLSHYMFFISQDPIYSLNLVLTSVAVTKDRFIFY
jgi:hypothetical protein